MTTATQAARLGVEIEDPLVLDAPDGHPWDEIADLVVVGLGGAGVAAAVEALEQGLSVIAVDRYEGGGSSAANGGVYYAGGGTAIQREAGETDTPEDFYNYLKIEAGEVVSDETLRRFVNESVPTLDWLMGHGAKFNSKVWKQKASYPPLDCFLYHPDNSLVANYRKRAKPAARGHRCHTRNGKKAWGLGIGIFRPLRDAALRMGMVFHRHSEARQLVVDKTGAVVGVKVLSIPANSADDRAFSRYIARASWLFGLLPPSFPLAGLTYGLANRFLAKARDIEHHRREARWIRARKGVVLSTGGYIINPKMIEEYAPAYSRGLPNGTLGDTGSGIFLGMSAGGDTRHMGRISAWRFINPPKAWGQSIAVNGKGERFVDETVYGATMGEQIGEHQGGVAWLVYDATIRKLAFWQAFDRNILPFQRDITLVNLMFNSRKAGTLAGLARQIGADPQVLQATVDRYNRAASGEEQDQFGKEPADMHPIANGPFFAMDISLDSRFLPIATMSVGGLRVDEPSGLVLDSAGAPIPGLYAAGRTAVGVASQTYVSGLSYADCIFSGRRAARYMSGVVRNGDAAGALGGDKGGEAGVSHGQLMGE